MIGEGANGGTQLLGLTTGAPVTTTWLAVSIPHQTFLVKLLGSYREILVFFRIIAKGIVNETC